MKFFNRNLEKMHFFLCFSHAFVDRFPTLEHLPLCSVNMLSPTVGLHRASLWPPLRWLSPDPEPPPPPPEPPPLTTPEDEDLMREPRSVEPPPRGALLTPLELEMQWGETEATGLLERPMQLTGAAEPPPPEWAPLSFPC